MKPIPFLRKSPIVGLLLLIVLLVGCSTNESSEIEKEIDPTAESKFLMGTIAKITVYDDREEVEAIIEKAFNRVEEIEDKMTINKDGHVSEITNVNDKSGIDFEKVSSETFFVLKRGLEYSEMFDGDYDITVGPVVKLWNIGMEEAQLPEESDIKEALQVVNYENLLLDEENKSAKLNKSDMIIDLGSIAKGYAADEAARVLKEEGVEHAIVNLGGNIVVINKKPDGSPWKLGLQDPIETRGDHMGIVYLDNETLVTSGTYERFLVVDDVNYHHILNTRTGYPENNDLSSVSIITQESIDADALSTGIFLLGLEEGYKKVEKLSGVEAIFITHDKKVYQTSGVDSDVFKITKKEYELHDFEVTE